MEQRQDNAILINIWVDFEYKQLGKIKLENQQLLYQIQDLTPSMQIWILLAILISLSMNQQLAPTIIINNTAILIDTNAQTVLQNGTVNRGFDDTVYNQMLNCNNDYLNIINNTNGNQSVFVYQNLGTILNSVNTIVQAGPNDFPQPQLISFSNSSFVLKFNCPSLSDIDSSNYYNKIDINVLDKYYISFLLSCDPQNRHKTFQFGYLLIAVLNAAILSGVAMYSRIWSIKWNGKRMRFNLRWMHIFGACVIGVLLVGGLYLVAFSNVQIAFQVLRYAGIIVSAFFVFVCFNEVFFLINKLKTQVYKMLRYCDIISIFCTVGVIVASFFVDSWIFYDFIAICICVASIKIFHFQSLKEAFLTQGIFVVMVTIVAIVLHFLLERSYNDYATELSSPLFLAVPDLTHNLYKKCSWLLVIDVIFPGVTLAYLRLYDENRSSRWGGVYTISGNITVVLSTILWVAIQGFYPYSVPFSLVTYLLFMLVIFLMAWRRNQWKTLYYGSFVKENSVVLEKETMEEKKKSFSSMMGSEIFDPLKTQRESIDPITEEK